MKKRESPDFRSPEVDISDELLTLQEIATLAIIQEISDSNQDTRIIGTKSGVSRIIWDS